MNYIAEINSFYDWLETNSLSTSAIVLWHALMHINNKSRWIEEFGVASSVLCVKTGLSERTIRNARNELKQKGRIDWKARGGNKAAIYQIIPLSAIDADILSDNASDTLSGNASGTTSALYKQNNTKHTIYIQGEEKIISYSLNKTLEKLLTDQSYLEMLCMNFRVRSLEIMEDYLKQFFAELETRGETYKDEKDAKYHFSNWLKNELRKKESYGNNKSNYSKAVSTHASNPTWSEPVNADATGIETLINSIAIG